MSPLVSVICLCYNHKSYLEEAIGSVLSQTYPNIEIIVVDDASTDGSKQVLRGICKENNLRFLDLQVNIGNCAAFNKGFFQSKGKYIIDFATDDVMTPTRIERQIKRFEELEDGYGVIFSNAKIVDDSGNYLRDHFQLDKNGDLVKSVPEGDIYAHLLSTYFISPPTMMIRREVLEDLGGYDESLAYEDFDFWVRSSRDYKYAFQNECLMNVRKARGSKSSLLYGTGDKQLLSTYKVCLKAAALNRNKVENQALINRIRYEARHAVLTGNFIEADLFFALLGKLNGTDFISIIFNIARLLKLPLKPVRKCYLHIRYGRRQSGK